MSDFDLQYVTKVCPELCQSEAEAVRDHVLDTWPADAVYPDVVKQAARSLFPYSAKPADNVHFINGSDKIRNAIKSLKVADAWLSRTTRTDDIAHISLDIQCCIHYLSTELRQMENPDVRKD